MLLNNSFYLLIDMQCMLGLSYSMFLFLYQRNIRKKRITGSPEGAYYKNILHDTPKGLHLVGYGNTRSMSSLLKCGGLAPTQLRGSL